MKIAGTSQSYGIHEPETVKWFMKMSTPRPIKSFQQKLHVRSTSFQDTEKVYVKCSQDVALDFMVSRAKDMKIPCYEINSGHFAMITSPEALASLLLKQG